MILEAIVNQILALPVPWLDIPPPVHAMANVLQACAMLPSPVCRSVPMSMASNSATPVTNEVNGHAFAPSVTSNHPHSPRVYAASEAVSGEVNDDGEYCYNRPTSK